ncbi:MAG: two-component system, NarL family, nitrate/nitrite response regulator NarL [Actinomycetota bacterium]|jgi:DNA-binding NarL/FixJ family response regulator|nr:two-component system, NarL family, nitrate/nitrite response regulator NarL [Actinomycetota bacterium]
MEERAIHVLLADEHALFRDAMRAVLTREDDIRVVADAGDGRTAVAEAIRTRPDVVVVDAGLRETDAVRTVAEVAREVPGCHILVLSAEEDEEILIGAIDAGATAYLTKSAAIDELIDAVRATHRGETQVPSHMLGHLLSRLVRRKRDQDEAISQIARLTAREREVLTLLARGLDNEGIASVLVISRHTARTHVQNVVTKLGVHSRLEAAMYATRAGVGDESLVLR